MRGFGMAITFEHNRLGWLPLTETLCGRTCRALLRHSWGGIDSGFTLRRVHLVELCVIGAAHLMGSGAQCGCSVLFFRGQE